MVYLVMEFTDYEGGEVLDAYTTLEAAQKYAAEYDSDNKSTHQYYRAVALGVKDE
jgi:hypothetical protein